MNTFSEKPFVSAAITDRKGGFLSIDDGFCVLLMRERRDIIGRTILDLTAEPFRSPNADKLGALRDSGKALVIRKDYVRGDGSRQ